MGYWKLSVDQASLSSVGKESSCNVGDLDLREKLLEASLKRMPHFPRLYFQDTHRFSMWKSKKDGYIRVQERINIVKYNQGLSITRSILQKEKLYHSLIPFRIRSFLWLKPPLDLLSKETEAKKHLWSSQPLETGPWKDRFFFIIGIWQKVKRN